ncbi:neuronal PAS domain-containing protein 1 isoform X1 [Homo sapiens]|uniref:neuronal PAS domain-containing protein 1 isoform X1 n=2 Tax=Homo sapiens TaxID=9606 RepID=UPI0007DC72DE|nr:neuronal PAS domain-containing protein 1 isoform X1 [Homo sapiens]XP_054177084.1 neuronal PAS domain-containing protein 1 isoform X1 [Homo sapiens]
MAAPYPGSGGGSEVKCVGGRGASVPWDFLPGLMVKAPSGPCLQAQRKEKSRNAARSRRGKENLEFFELAKLLPLPGAISSQLDKASIVRLSVTYLRLRRFAALGAPPWGLRAAGPPAGLAPGRRGPAALVSEVFEQHLGGHILQSLDGFVFALNQEGKFLYISETVSIYLGLSQVEMTGSSVFDYIHPGDHSEVLEQLGLRTPTPGPPTPPSVSSSSSSSSSLADTPEIEASLTKVPPSSLVQERSFFVRMKSTLTKRGLHVKASGYKVIHVTGRLRAHALGLVALGHTLPPAPLAELPLHGHMIVFRLSLGLTILACESRVSDHMDLGPSELVGRSCYQFVHGQDATRIRQSHVDCETHLHPPSLPTTPQTRASHSLVPGSPSSGLPTVPPAAPTAPGTPFSIGRAARRLSDASGLLDKGQVMTGYYRWLQRAGGFVWLQSVATVAGSGKSPGEHHVLWVSHVLSQAEGGQTPLDAFQLPASVACEEASSPGPEPTEPEPPTEGKQAAPAENEAPQTQGKRIKVEPGPRETKGSEDSGDEDPSSHPATPRPEFTSVIRAGVLKQDPVRPWGLAPPGDPPPTLLHAGFLPPVVRGLCTPGTIRYGPAELGLVYPHLQRLGPGPALPEAFYPPLGLPYPGPAGTRLPRKGD